MSLLIHNVLIITQNDTNDILTDHAVVIDDTRIAAIGPEAELKAQHPDAEKIDGQGKLLMPGLVNAHMHFYSAFARGIALPGAPKNFLETLQMLWWKLDSSLDLDGVYYSALIPSITAIKKGVTAIIDHHASAQAVDGSLDRIEEAMTRLGIRGALCYETSDRDGKDIARQGLRENERYIKKCLAAKKADPDHLFDALFGLHASFTLDNDTLEQAVAIAQSLQKGFHVHVSEDGVDGVVTREKYKAELVQRLQDFNILGPQTITAHCIHLSEAEKDLLAQTDTILAHTPQSNMNNAVGRADIPGYFRRGMLMGLGTDGMSADLKPDARTANLLHKHDLRDSNVVWQEIQQMVLKNNPAIWGRVTGQQVGQIREGYLADLILVDYYPPTPLTGDNFWGHFLFGMADADVNTSIINGTIVMKDKVIVGIDEQEVARAAMPVAIQTWERFGR